MPFIVFSYKQHCFIIHFSFKISKKYQHNTLFLSFVSFTGQCSNTILTPSYPQRMIMEESETNPTSDHILEWLEDSISTFPSFYDDPYEPGVINTDSWWYQDQDQDQDQDFGQELHNSTICNSFNSNSIITTATSTALVDYPNGNFPCTGSGTATPTESIISNQPQPSDSSKKRKVNPRKNHNRQNREGADYGSIGNKRAKVKSTGNNCNNGNNKDERWAEQLLNPCAVGITSGDLNRVQHLLCVINELGSLTGDANHRLAWYGLRALARNVYSSSSFVSHGALTFVSTEEKIFKKTLIDFSDINPWFRIPNSIANSSILQILSEQDPACKLHILDIGVSHGVQWPTLLEELSRRSGGPPPLVKITVVSPMAEKDHPFADTPFAVGPIGYDFSPFLLGFAKKMNINLHINRIDDQPLQNLNSHVIGSGPDETLIVCAQFRLHQLNHNSPDNRTEFLRLVRDLDPKGVILSENDTDCSCNNCGNFSTAFSRRVEHLWKFLDSTSAAFKGRESEERRMMEGEAAKALVNLGEMNDRKEKWCERMKEVGFVGEVFAEDTVDGARALLRKYDINWEMRIEESSSNDYCVRLWWKGQPVSFCSLWKLDSKANGI